MKNNFLDQFYTINPETGDYIIEIALENYHDVFNSWDSSVYNIRDLDSSLKAFLEDCCYDIGKRKNVILRFHISNQEKNTEMEDNIQKGIKNYYNYCSYITKTQFNSRISKTIIYVISSLSFTLLSIFLRSVVTNHVIKEIMLLNFTVGGWVFLWEAFSLLFIQSGDWWKKKMLYKRILKAPIKFRYNKDK